MRATAGFILVLAFVGVSADCPTSSENYPQYSDEYEGGWSAYAVSAENYSEYTHPESEYNGGEYGEQIEGDLILSQQQKMYLDEEPPRGTTSKSFRWPDGKVFYSIHHGHFDAKHNNYILQAMQQIEEVSCVRFYEARDYENDYINITGFHDNCYAQVGCIGSAQSLNLHPHYLDTGCFRLGTIVHELLHALGFFHQNNVADRDTFITTIPYNMRPYAKQNFARYLTSFVVDFGLSYDHQSILHFHPKAFSRNGEDTIAARCAPPFKPCPMGQREGITIKDVAKLNMMYDCTIPFEKLEKFVMVLCGKYK